METGRLNKNKFSHRLHIVISMQMIFISCDHCGEKVEKPFSEIKRNRKLARKCFCNLSCSAAYRNENMMPEKRASWNIYNISKHAGNQHDELSSFRPYLNSGRASNKKHN